MIELFNLYMQKRELEKRRDKFVNSGYMLGDPQKTEVVKLLKEIEEMEVELKKALKSTGSK